MTFLPAATLSMMRRHRRQHSSNVVYRSVRNRFNRSALRRWGRRLRRGAVCQQPNRDCRHEKGQQSGLGPDQMPAVLRRSSPAWRA